ncbi:hypothetical protein D3C81_1158570 [compost metagenome]
MLLQFLKEQKVGFQNGPLSLFCLMQIMLTTINIWHRCRSVVMERLILEQMPSMRIFSLSLEAGISIVRIGLRLIG